MIVLIILVLSVRVHSLSYFPCNESLCPPFEPSNCPYGVTKDIYDCCPECAKGEGDECGGIYYKFGHCTGGSKCMVEIEFGLPYYLYIQKNGTCKSPVIKEKKECKEPCSVDFCGRDDRNRLCSAARTSFSDVPGREPCQHTTCKACRLHVLPNCPTCPEPVQKKCLKKFYLCVSDHYKKGDIILELNDARARKALGKIICQVPQVTT